MVAILSQEIEAIDLFCGVGGLTHGLEQAGVNVKAGYDLDKKCRYPYEENNDADYISQDVKSLEPEKVSSHFSEGSKTLIAGCAPCQPFSNMSNDSTKKDSKWALLKDFARIVENIKPDFVTMENVPPVRNYKVFEEFVSRLENSGYEVNYNQVYAPKYGIPQTRKRLILIASLDKECKLPDPIYAKEESYPTVREKIGDLPEITAGEKHSEDPLHWCAGLSQKNLKRIRQSSPGGTWEDWDDDLILDCHKKDSGSSYKSVYGRMEWDEPSPTITTQAYAYGSGRFGHPEQDRAISLREAAMLQTFPENYKFIDPEDEDPNKTEIGRMIGNAVPVKLGRIIGEKFLEKV